MLSASIKDFKVRNNSIIYFISVKLGSAKNYTVEHNLKDFELLHVLITETLMEIPSCNIPAFPTFTVKSGNQMVEERMKKLTRYLKELCVPAFICEDLLDFL